MGPFAKERPKSSQLAMQSPTMVIVPCMLRGMTVTGFAHLGLVHGDS
jgi:hypothetical protein